MINCRVCLQPKNNNEMVWRNTKMTHTCIDCSKKRKEKDYCFHNKREHDCPECVDPLVRRATAIIHSSRISDKKRGRVCDLDFTWSIDQITKTPNCSYCNVELQYLAPYIPNFATIDRINDSLGHTKDNCVIACRSCNCGQNKYKYFLKK
jgi:hypothetical protein